MLTTATAQRIQRRRVKGWRIPAGVVYVGRPSRWGNPFAVGEVTPSDWPVPFGEITITSRAQAVDLFTVYATAYRRDDYRHAIQGALNGRDLACWCPLDVPCHADVLLRIANPQRHWMETSPC